MVSKPTFMLCLRIAIVVVLATDLFLTGCGKRGLPRSVSDTKAFETASEEIKADWSKAVSAATTNDYATAIITCRKLQMIKELTPQQVTAINATISALNQEILEGLQKGDPSAIQANETIMKSVR
jgi:hypothetical protein